MIDEKFVDCVIRLNEGNEFCYYVHKHIHGFIGYNNGGFDCSLCLDKTAYIDRYAEKPCTVEDFKKCPLFH